MAKNSPKPLLTAIDQLISAAGKPVSAEHIALRAACSLEAADAYLNFLELLGVIGRDSKRRAVSVDRENCRLLLQSLRVFCATSQPVLGDLTENGATRPWVHVFREIEKRRLSMGSRFAYPIRFVVAAALAIVGEHKGERYVLVEYSPKRGKAGTLRLIGGKREPAERLLLRTIQRELAEEIQDDVSSVLTVDRTAVASCSNRKELSNSRGAYTCYDITVFKVASYLGRFTYAAAMTRNLYWVRVEDFLRRMDQEPGAFGLGARLPGVRDHLQRTPILYPLQARDLHRAKKV